MQQYAAGLRPAGVQPKRGRPRIHPPKQPKKPRQPKAQPAGGAGAAAAAPAAPAELTPPPAAATDAWALGELALLPAPALGTGDVGEDAPAAGTSGKRRARRPKLAESTFIESEERRQQVGGLQPWQQCKPAFGPGPGPCCAVLRRAAHCTHPAELLAFLGCQLAPLICCHLFYHYHTRRPTPAARCTTCGWKR